MGLEENKVQKRILEFINNKEYNFNKITRGKVVDGALFRVNNKGIKGRKSTLPKGFPDIVGDISFSNRKGVSIYIECKASNKKCKDKNQVEFIGKAVSRGTIAGISDSLESFIELLMSYFLE